jgi:hypothetical protein
VLGAFTPVEGEALVAQLGTDPFEFPLGLDSLAGLAAPGACAADDGVPFRDQLVDPAYLGICQGRFVVRG